MGYQEQFEQTIAYEAINQFIEDPEFNHKNQFESSLIEEVESLSDLSVEELDEAVKYYVDNGEESNEHFYVVAIFDKDDELQEVRVDVGSVAAPLAGHGYSWEFNPSGEIEFEGPWIS